LTTNVNPDDEASEVCQRMAALRRELDGDMRDVTESARAMTDWTFYVRRFPWAAAGAAALAGFLLVPRKKQVMAPPDAATLAELAKHKELWASAATPPASDANSIAKTIFWTIAAAAGRAALAYVSEQISKPASERRRETEQSASSLHESKSAE
jgi:hypothetical protein